MCAVPTVYILSRKPYVTVRRKTEVEIWVFSHHSHISPLSTCIIYAHRLTGQRGGLGESGKLRDLQAVKNTAGEVARRHQDYLANQEGEALGEGGDNRCSDIYESRASTRVNEEHTTCHHTTILLLKSEQISLLRNGNIPGTQIRRSRTISGV